MKKNKLITGILNIIDSNHKAVALSNYYINRNKKKRNRYGLINLYIRNKLHCKYNIILGENVVSKTDLVLPHPQNIVIGNNVKFGSNCWIYHNVTIGQKNNKYPVIGDNVIINTGTVIFGDIKIGNNVVIGANSVVTKDFPDNSIIAGVPAIIIGERT